MKEEPVNLNWTLLPVESSPGRMLRPQLCFNIAYPAVEKNLRCRNGKEQYRKLSRSEREQPAAENGALGKMVIRCDSLPEWAQWHIVVKRADGIQCIDVFEEMYKTYNVMLTPGERALIPAEALEVCRLACSTRCKVGPGLETYEKEQGIKRVDLLGGSTYFRGLTWNPKAGANWVVHFYP